MAASRRDLSSKQVHDMFDDSDNDDDVDLDLSCDSSDSSDSDDALACDVHCPSKPGLCDFVLTLVSNFITVRSSTGNNVQFCSFVLQFLFCILY